AQPRVAVRGRQRRQMGSLLKAFAHLVQWRIAVAPRLRQRIKIAHARLNYIKRINHLQRAILTNQLFRLAPQRLYVFREGFDTRDLKDAKALVEELAEMEY